MDFKEQTLNNGLKIIGEYNGNAKSAAVGFFVRTGARDEKADINGVSHFLEHMVFKGTEKLNAFEVNEAFDRTGAQFNAFTTEELTVFYAAVLPEYLEEVTNLWTELMRPALRNSDFDIEKNVIKEEIAMYQDLPEFDVAEKCRILHFDGHPCGNCVLGSVESIDNLTANQMRSYFDNRYAPNNIILALTGNFNWEVICGLAENKCSKWQHKDTFRMTEDYAGSGKKDRLVKPNITREHICLISRGIPAQDKRRFAAFLLACIIGDSIGSRFFWELVDNALAESAAMQFGPMDQTGIFFSQLQCGKDKAKQVMEIVRNIFRDVTEKGVTEAELTKAKNKILSALVIKNEVPMGRLLDVGLNWLYLGLYHTVADEIDFIKAVKIEDISELAGQINLEKFTEFSIGHE